MFREHDEKVTIKLRVDSGCFCESHYPEANAIFSKYRHSRENDFEIIPHENGPEIIAWLTLAASGISALTSVASLIVDIIKARKKDSEKKGGREFGKIIMYLRDTKEDWDGMTKEETVLEIYESDVVDTEVIKKAIEKGLAKRKKK